MESLDQSCVLLQGGQEYENTQGHVARRGISTESCGAQALGMHVVEIPPGGDPKPHRHPNHESAIYVVQGEADVWHGPGLDQYFRMRAGDMAYIPPGVPHLSRNRSSTDTVIAVVTRTDPAEDEAVELMDLPAQLRVPRAKG